MIDQLTIDPALWQGDTLEKRLQNHFSDMLTPEGFKSWVTACRDRDASAKHSGWRRIFSSQGKPVLIALMTWKEKSSPWRFAIESFFDDPADGRRYYVFGARLKGIRLDYGIAIPVEIYTALPGMDVPPRNEKAR